MTANNSFHWLRVLHRRSIVALISITLMLTSSPAWAQSALPQRTMKWQALAERVVEQLQLEPGEKVVLMGRPGIFEEIVPHLRYAVMSAGGVDLGLIHTLDEPFPEDWDEATLRQGFAASRAAYMELLKDVDVGVMLPGANPVQPAYGALQMLLFNEGGPRRTIHMHWTDVYSSSGNEFGLMGVTVLPGHPPPPLQVIDAIYQRAVLETDLKALSKHQARFADALRDGEVHITSLAGTDLRFRVGDRDIIQQNGDASAARMRQNAAFLTREVEIPGGAVRVAPVEENVNGIIVYPYSSWSGQSVINARLTIENGTIVATDADVGAEYVAQELAEAPEETRRFREFALGMNPLLAIPEDNASWIPYFGYGAGIVRLGIGSNVELGGAVRGRYFRWRDLLSDATVTVDGEVWVEKGKLVK